MNLCCSNIIFLRGIHKVLLNWIELNWNELKRIRKVLSHDTNSWYKDRKYPVMVFPFVLFFLCTYLLIGWRGRLTIALCFPTAAAGDSVWEIVDGGNLFGQPEEHILRMTSKPHCSHLIGGNLRPPGISYERELCDTYSTKLFNSSSCLVLCFIHVCFSFNR